MKLKCKLISELYKWNEYTIMLFLRINNVKLDAVVKCGLIKTVQYDVSLKKGL